MKNSPEPGGPAPGSAPLAPIPSPGPSDPSLRAAMRVGRRSGPRVNCRPAPGTEASEIYGGLAVPGTPGETRVHAGGASSQLSAGSAALTTPSVWESSVTTPPPPPPLLGGKKPSAAIRCLRGSEEALAKRRWRAPPAEEESMCGSLHPAFAFTKHASTLSSSTDGGGGVHEPRRPKTGDKN